MQPLDAASEMEGVLRFWSDATIGRIVRRLLRYCINKSQQWLALRGRGAEITGSFIGDIIRRPSNLKRCVQCESDTSADHLLPSGVVVKRVWTHSATFVAYRAPFNIPQSSSNWRRHCLPVRSMITGAAVSLERTPFFPRSPGGHHNHETFPFAGHCHQAPLIR